ncbi:MAG TPA: hypothetical protein VKU19_36470 [Bryobacteraceae bacterium]|nr:hypothetical protein [Bryobacteraceae bacterium]
MDPMQNIQKQLRILRAWAVVSTVLFAALILVAADSESSKSKFDEIDTQRINILGEDGKLRLTISNNEKSPGPIIGGKAMKSRDGKRGAGLIFFNDNGDECGGMTWHGQKKDGMVNANSGLMFDQYDSDQTVGIQYSQQGDNRSSGLHVWERSLKPMGEFAQQVNDAKLMKDGPEKTEALKKVRERALADGLAGVQRVFVGRTPQNDAVVLLMDTKGKARIRLAVDSANAASLQFLDENGRTVLTLPNSPPAPK